MERNIKISFLRTKLVVFVILLLTATVYPRQIKVPQDFPKIQTAIDNSSNGDTVLVSPGLYFENINFYGKKIVVASQFLITRQLSAIRETIIDGSKSENPNAASCVMMVSGEDTSTVLEGFTLTGGKGTLWTDEHNGKKYREGGAILITLSSPKIRNNYIVNNQALYTSGATSSGGGAIRCGDGSPVIINNVIVGNSGMYGGAIVLNYCSGSIIKNNIITQNRASQSVSGVPSFGGGGIWVFEKLPGNTAANIIANNTIVNNSSTATSTTNGAGKGGGVLLWLCNVKFTNNIVWNNKQSQGGQMASLNVSSLIADYNDVQDNLTGAGNISMNPEFADSCFYLKDNSPLIDAGNPDPAYNDPVNSSNPSSAVSPAKGTQRSDIGAYGGPQSGFLTYLSAPAMNMPPSVNLGNILPDSQESYTVTINNGGSSPVKIDSIAVPSVYKADIIVSTALPLIIHPAESGTFNFTWKPAQNYKLSDSIALYHNDNNLKKPLYLHLSGNSNPLPKLQMNLSTMNFGELNVNASEKDSVFYVKNIGTGDDSVHVAIAPQGVTPISAVSVSPEDFFLAKNDSEAVKITILPSAVNSGSGLYMPIVKIDSRFSEGIKHFERILMFKLTGTTNVTASGDGPNEFFLSQNYPNPFNPATKIGYGIKNDSYVRLTVYDMLGREVNRLVDEFQKAGNYNVIFSGSHIAGGIYLYKLEAGSYVSVKKLLLLK